jgi:hypothetical protein
VRVHGGGYQVRIQCLACCDHLGRRVAGRSCRLARLP